MFPHEVENSIIWKLNLNADLSSRTQNPHNYWKLAIFVFFEVTRKWCKIFWSSLGVTSVYNKYSTLLLTFSAQYIHVLSETKINFLSRDRQISAFWIFLNNSPCKGFFKNCVISETVILRWLKVTLKGTMSKREGNDFPQSTF